MAVEKKWLVALVLIVAVLVGAWFIPVYEGKNIYELVKEKIVEMFKHEGKEK